MNNKRQQTIVCAANLYVPTGLILCGARHWDNIMREQARAIFKDKEKVPVLGWEQGFIDQYGTFLTRKEAMEIVIQNRQPFDFERNGHQMEELYSEGIC